MIPLQLYKSQDSTQLARDKLTKSSNCTMQLAIDHMKMGVGKADSHMLCVA